LWTATDNSLLLRAPHGGDASSGIIHGPLGLRGYFERIACARIAAPAVPNTRSDTGPNIPLQTRRAK
jgi:hypothetical protein